MEVQLNFINNSNDANNSQIVIFQKNVAADVIDAPIAWTVIDNCGVGENHPFTWHTNMAVSSSDMSGNYTRQIIARPGQGFSAFHDGNADTLTPSNPSIHPGEIEVANNMLDVSVNAHIFNSGKRVATQLLKPAQTARFEFNPVISIGATSQLREGDVLSAAVLAEIGTELTLRGVASADIVMTGGGVGPTATPLVFSLENVKHG